MIKRLVIAAILLGAVVGGIVWFKYFRDEMIAQYLGGMVPPPVPVNVETVAPVAWTPGIDAIGTSLSVRGVDLAIESGGTVRELAFTGNDSAAQGQLLVQIDDDSEKASLAAAQAGLSVAATELRRAQTLSERGVNAQTTVETAQAQVESARAQVAQAQTALDNKRMVAPFAGVIGIPRIELGEYVAAGTIYATLQDTTKMRVDFNVPEQQIGALKIDGPVLATSEVGDLSAKGRIIAIEPKIDPASRMVAVRAEVDNTESRLIPGQFLRVRIELPVEEGVIALPQTAVSTTLYGDTVFVVHGEGEDLTVSQVFVTAGRRFGGRIEVTKGIAAGDRVVISGQNRLSAGARIKVDDSVDVNQTTGE